MQVCTSLQTDNHASTPPLKFFYRPDALPATQPTAPSTEGTHYATASNICISYVVAAWTPVHISDGKQWLISL